MNPKSFWNYIRNKKSPNNNNKLRTYKGKSYSDQDKIANIYAEYFSSVFSTSNDDSRRNKIDNKVIGSTINNVKLSKITSKEVSKALKKLKPKRSLGPDQISLYVYKACGEFLVTPLTYLFNLIIEKKKIPATWKVSKISPVPKSEHTIDVENCRPIALIPVPTNVFKSIIHNQIFEQIKNNIANKQHCFYRTRSVMTVQQGVGRKPI
jgi:hypothetical protein